MKETVFCSIRNIATVLRFGVTAKYADLIPVSVKCVFLCLNFILMCVVPSLCTSFCSTLDIIFGDLRHFPNKIFMKN